MGPCSPNIQHENLPITNLAGAGHAAFIARFERVSRAASFPRLTDPAPWTQADDFTPAGALWGFGLPHSSWDSFGIPGTPTSFDGATAPFSTRQHLTTANSDCSGDPMKNGFYH